MNTERQVEYYIAISYAGEDDAFVSAVADRPRAHGVRRFFAPYQTAQLLVEDIAVKFSKILPTQARRVLMFVSEHYARKFWPRQETRAAIAGALRQNHVLVDHRTKFAGRVRARLMKRSPADLLVPNGRVTVGRGGGLIRRCLA